MPRSDRQGVSRATGRSGVRLLQAVPQERRGNLPADVSSFIGREAAIAQVVTLLSAHRLVTLSGAPGVGKTRLAVRVAEELRNGFRGGVWIAELAGLDEPGLVPSALAAVLGLREEGGRSPTELLRDRLQHDQVLLLLDNCEHLLDACAALIDDLLRSCPSVRVLATSRESLGLAGEVCWSVQPLTLPDDVGSAEDAAAHGGEETERARVEAVLASEAGQLFVQRAQAVRTGLVLTTESSTAVARICRQLDGLPLAIELAAAWVAALSPGQISAWLDDRFTLLTRAGRTARPHQRTLRESLDWSYELLSDAERVLLRRLAIFRGSWTLDAADAIAGDGWPAAGDGPPAGGDGSPAASDWVAASRAGTARLQRPPRHTTLNLLAGLVAKSLVQVEERDGETRYSFLETIRQYAADRLEAAGEDDVLARHHGDWCLAFADRAAADLRGPRQTEWRARLEYEHDNLRAALGRAVERGDAELGLRLAFALWHFWIDRGYSGEGYTWLRRLLELPSAAQRTASRAAGLFLAAKFAFEGALLATAHDLGEESLSIAREVGDLLTLHRALTQLGHIARGRGEWLAARRYYEEALPIRRDVGEPVDVAVSLACLGHVARALGEYDVARSLYDESLALASSEGHPAEITAVQHDLGRLAHERGLHDEAATWYATALPVARRIDHPRRMAYLLEGFAALAAPKQHEHALRLAGAAAALRQVSGSLLPPSDHAALERELAPARRALGETTCAVAWAAGAALTADEAVSLALSRLPGGPTRAAIDAPARLTAREREVAGLVARGLTNRQIAEELVLSERTAEWHVTNSLGKLGLSTRAQLAVWASGHGLAAPAGASPT